MAQKSGQEDARPRYRRWAGELVAGLVLASITAIPALAELKLCNSTVGRVGVAIGYKEASGWTTEGWWTIAGQTCETLLKGKLPSQILYVHAVDYDRGGEWAGEIALCIADKPFTIRDNADCESKGYKKANFMKVDTQGQRIWTIQLGDPPDTEKAK